MPKEQDNKINELLEMLEKGVHDLFQTEKYQIYLTTMNKFHDYSVDNMILIAYQRPDASLVAGFKTWETKFHRHVKKGEKGIKIRSPMGIKVTRKREKRDEAGKIVLAEDGSPQMEEIQMTVPKFRTVTVFDISQTVGEPLPERPGVQDLTAKVDGYSSFIAAIKEISPVPIRYEDDISPCTAKGFYDPERKEIVLKSGMPESQTVKTLVHEVAHAKIHDPDKAFAVGRRKDQTTREVEAESVAFLVCQNFNIDTSQYSFPYVAAWSSTVDMPELRASMEVIRSTATEMIDELTERIHLELESKQQEVSIEKFAVALDRFASEFDPYEYRDTVYDSEQNIQNIVYKIKTHETAELKNWLKEASASSTKKEEKIINDLLLQLRASETQEHQKDIDCKRAIEDAIDSQYNYQTCILNTNEAVRAVIENFGAERTKFVLATTVCMKDFDRRFSPETRAWAKDFVKDENDNCLGRDLIINSHPALLDGFITKTRQYNEFEKCIPDKELLDEDKKESVLEKLHHNQRLVREAPEQNLFHAEREDLSL